MKLNYDKVLLGDRAVLVPYRSEHVPRYHEWMKDPFLLEATGSEPLSLEEEYEMQQTWRDDDAKCTFIVLSREKCVEETESFIVDNLEAMVGDVNLFLSEIESTIHSDDEQNVSEERQEPQWQAELDIMIAEKDDRGRGIGREAVGMMMLYGATKLRIQRFFCKINEDNESSLALFRKIGFVQCDYAECFKQVEVELRCESVDEMVDLAVKILGKDSLTTRNCHITTEETDPK